MPNIHEHYNQLTQPERGFVSEAMSEIESLRRRRANAGHTEGAPPLANDDRAERAADALARWVIESRTS